MAQSKGQNLFPEEGQNIFPEETSSYIPEKISQSNEQMGWPGVWQDIKQKASGIPGAISNFISSLPEEASASSEQLNTKPGRAVLNVISGIGGGTRGLLNLPYNIIKELGEKKVIPQALKAYNERPFTHIPEDVGFDKYFGLDKPERGDFLNHLVGELYGGPKVVNKIAEKAFKPTLTKELNNLNTKIEKIQSHHSTYLAPQQEHAARAAQQFLNHIEGEVNPVTNRREGGLRQQIGSEYDKLANDMRNDNIQILVTPDIKDVQKYISKLGKNVTKEEKENLLKVTTHGLHKNKTINGADALISYRELKRQANKAFQNAHEEGIGPKEHQDWINKGNELLEQQNKLKKILEEQVGGNYLERLKNIDRAWATQIAPLSENPLYQEMRKHGQTSKNIMKYLNGSTKGNDILNSIVGQKPELQRLIFAQQYAANPSKLGEPNELTEKYKKLNPVISKVIDEQKAIKNIKENKIPALQKSIEKAEKKKTFRKGIATGATAVGVTAAIENLLGRDWKEDLPWLAAIYASTLKGHK